MVASDCFKSSKYKDDSDYFKTSSSLENEEEEWNNSNNIKQRRRRQQQRIPVIKNQWLSPSNKELNSIN